MDAFDKICYLTGELRINDVITFGEMKRLNEMYQQQIKSILFDEINEYK